MRIVIAGGSGFIGTHLRAYFEQKGDEVVSLLRPEYDDALRNDLIRKIDGCDALINLCGASINKRWSSSYKDELIESRLRPTRALTDAIGECRQAPSVFLSASAIGAYPSEGEYTDYSLERGQGFLANLCREWESEAVRCSSLCRVVTMRFGVVLSSDGGALKEMLDKQRLFRIGAIIGSGKQWFSWIGMQDLCRACAFIMHQSNLSEVVNLVSPCISTQRDFAKRLAREEGVRLVLPIPVFVFKCLFGQGASVLTDGQYAYPQKLMDAGFAFHQTSVADLL